MKNYLITYKAGRIELFSVEIGAYNKITAMNLAAAKMEDALSDSKKDSITTIYVKVI